MGYDGVSAPWYSDCALVAQMPIEYRALAAYCRIVEQWSALGEIAGMWRGWMMIGELRRRTGRGTTLLVHVNGNPLEIDLLDPRAIWALREVRGEDPESRLLAQLLRPGDSFLDIGSNHGAYAIVASRLVGPAGRVLAFEPQPRLAAMIRRSLVAAGRGEADVLEVACSDREGTAVLSIPRRMSGSASIFGAVTADHVTTSHVVRVATLDALLADRPLPGRLVVKLDVEGAELAVLKGAAGTIAERRPPILLEINPVTSRGAGYVPSDLIDWLDGLGYRWFTAPERYPQVSDAASVDLSHQHNILALLEAPR